MAAYAAPKNPMPQTIIQPDGTNIVIIERGDEFISWATDTNGYLVAYDEKTGFWKYAYVDELSVPADQHVNVNITLPASDGQKHLAETYMPLFASIGEKNRIAHNSDKMAYYAAYEKMLAQAAAFEPFSTAPAVPAYRNRRVLLVVIDYRDQKSYVGGRDDKFWYDMYFNTTPGHKSVKNFFKDMADGRDVYIEASTAGIPATPTNIGHISWNHANAPQWVRSGAGVIINSPYPGFIRMQIDAPRPAGNAVNEQSIPMILAAIQSHYPELFAAYQTLGASNLRIALVTPNGGGYAFWVQHTPLGGIDAAGNGHTWQVGPHIHESAHAYFSLPDLYSYDAVTPARPVAEGVGFYCVMSYGMYGNLPGEPSASTPVAMSAPLRDRLGWGNTIVVAPEYSWDGNLVPIGHPGHHLLRVNSAVDATQYFIVDNIAFENWNRTLQGNHNNGGVLIYHVNAAAHSTPFGFGANSYWTRGQRFTIHVELADGSMYDANGNVRDWGSWSLRSTHYFRSGNNDTFNASSNPNSHFYRATSPHTKNVPSNIDIRVPGVASNSMQVQVIGKNPPEPTEPAITTAALEDGNVETAYNQALRASGTTPILWELASGDLPPGLSLSPTGVISGTPTEAGSYTFVVKATNSAGSDERELSITINDKIISDHCDGVPNFEEANKMGAAGLIRVIYDGKLWVNAVNNAGAFTNIFLESQWTFLEECDGGGTISIVNVERSNNRYGIKFAINPVSDNAEINVVLPNNERAVETNVVIYDMVGNVVFEEKATNRTPVCKVVWDLRNTAGRFVANGTYLVIAEAKDRSGAVYRYSARLGVNR